MTFTDMAVVHYQKTKKSEDFEKVACLCMSVFRYWYRHVQRFVKIDRRSLLSEFYYLLWRSLVHYKHQPAKEDGFLRYLRAASKKQCYAIQRKNRSDTVHIKESMRIVDDRAQYEIEKFELMDLVNTVFKGQEREIIALKLAGYGSGDIQKQMSLSPYEYRVLDGKIKDRADVCQEYMSHV